jgi:chromosome partitioning protein
LNVLAFFSIKGGVGKTASCVNVAYLSAAEESRTLLCDLDPQGSASFYLRIAPSKKHDSRRLLKGGKRLVRSIRGSDFDSLDLLPADLSYRHLDILLNDMKRSKKRLRDLLSPLARDYDYIFLDCPPGLTLASENVFRAADYIWIPLIPTVLSVRSFEKLLSFFEESGLDKSRLFPFLSMVEKRKLMVRHILRDPVLEKRPPMDAAIPYLSEIEQMGLYRQPLTHRRPQSKGADAYRKLWEEMKGIMHSKGGSP